jgi:hypothetical protein
MFIANAVKHQSSNDDQKGRNKKTKQRIIVEVVKYLLYIIQCQWRIGINIGRNKTCTSESEGKYY